MADSSQPDISSTQQAVVNGSARGKENIANGHAPEPAQTTAPRIPSISAPSDKPSLADNATVDGSTTPVKTPFIHPIPSSTPATRPALTADQQTKYNSLLNKAQFWPSIPTTSKPDAPVSPLTDSERLWLTRECLLRYLRAAKWNEAQATARVQATLVWRREYGVEGHTADYISEENETGKQVLLGYDNEGRPCLYLNPHLQNTKGKEKQIQHLVFMLERCIDLLPPGQETLVLLVNFKESRKGEGATVAQARQTLNILQNHYPERLGKACVKDVPWLIWGFFKIITPFIDPTTKEKMKFDEDLTKIVPPAQLLKKFGGDVDFEYDHEKYWPALNGLAEARRKEMRERWEAGGNRVGESEEFLRGRGESVSVNDEKAKKEKMGNGSLGVESPKLRRTPSFQDDIKS
ncbi:hypothetical protein ABVK25_000457 [Lepraria finkii]|uniref:CRAL-TRIO domain-containing protein n=1 Tax=Lepraria finkii TaxID=1340010 RepID=A0ABR4BN09_9LECA